MKQAKDIMSKDIITIPSHKSIYYASKLMKEYNIGFLPVVDNGYIYGVITDRDIVIRALSNNSLFSSIRSCATTSPLYMVKEDTYIDDIIKLMSEKQIRRILVLNKYNNLTGIISLKDIVLNTDNDIKDIFIRCKNPINYMDNEMKI
jgi:CBS domain-containing protein